MATFAEMLEAELNCTNVPPPAGRASAAWNRPLTTPLFVFDLPRPAGPVSGVHRRSSQSPGSEEPTTPRNEPPTPRIVLSTFERRALAMLNDLGADLDDSLSPSTLRRAFRQLAHRYHPDRHPGRNAAELQQLARLFTEATEHYRVLAAALARSA